MGNCARFGAVSRDGLPREKDRRERECVAVLSGGELDGGRRAIMWVSPHTQKELLPERIKYPSSSNYF